jgi:hypothetical protein
VCHRPRGGPVSPSHWKVRLGPSFLAVRLTKGRRGGGLLGPAAPTSRTVTASLAGAGGTLDFFAGGGPSAGTGMISTEGVSKVRLGAEVNVEELDEVEGGGVGFLTGFDTSGNTSTKAEGSLGHKLLMTLKENLKISFKGLLCVLFIKIAYFSLWDLRKALLETLSLV